MFSRYINSSWHCLGVEAALLVSAALLAGCNGSVELGRVTGTVRMDGQPVKFAQVTFIPDGPGRSSSALANEQGEYVMEYTPSAAGALVGPVTVRISTATVSHPETIPPIYNVKTELHREVKAGKNVIDFELTTPKGFVPKKAPPLEGYTQ